MTDEPAYGDFALKRFLGMEIEGDEPGRARGRVTIGEQHLNPNGVVHGAVLFALVDTAMGKAVMSTLPEGRFCASVDVQLRFVRPASEGELVADVEVLRQGRQVVHLDARVHDGADRLIATAAGTFAVIAG
ncbi:MAG TPA: PaaI family thioesterase [Acidimicrobiales bacterium]|nr:PaaI family thioesterase [Acidimicrobiales bacterium]